MMSYMTVMLNAFYTRYNYIRIHSRIMTHHNNMYIFIRKLYASMDLYELKITQRFKMYKFLNLTSSSLRGKSNCQHAN